METTKLDCGHIIPVGNHSVGPSSPVIRGTMYAKTEDGKKICYACCAAKDIDSMIRLGHSRHLPLYLSTVSELASVSNSTNCVPGQSRVRKEVWAVTNWPGSLRFPIRNISFGKHNIAESRTDVWFKGPDGFIWHGTQYGEWTQIVHCKRTKERS